MAALAFWALGALWYSPVLFSKRWQKEVGFKEEDISKANMAMVFGLSFLCMLFMVWALNFVINSHKAEDVSLVKGLLVGRHPGAEQGVEPDRLDPGLRILRPGAELVGQGSQGDSTRIPTGFISQVGDILALVSFL